MLIDTIFTFLVEFSTRYLFPTCLRDDESVLLRWSPLLCFALAAACLIPGVEEHLESISHLLSFSYFYLIALGVIMILIRFCLAKEE